MVDLISDMIKKSEPVKPCPTSILMSSLTIQHILEDQPEISPGNFDGFDTLKGLKIIKDEGIPYGFARIKYSDATHKDIRVRVMIAIKWR